MGYEVTGKGHVVLKNVKTVDSFKEALNGAVEYLDDFFVRTQNTGIFVGFYFSGRFDDDFFLAVLNSFLNDFVDVEIDFVGEDDAKWNIVLENGKLEEHWGMTVYSGSIVIGKEELNDLAEKIILDCADYIVPDTENIVKQSIIKRIEEHRV